MIGFAESRKRNEADPSLRLSPGDQSKLESISGQLKALQDHRSLKIYRKDTPQTAARKAVHDRSKLNEFANALESIAESIKELSNPSGKAGNQMLFSSGTRCRPHLDDAVTVMRNISSSPKPSVPMTPTEIENLIGKGVIRLCLPLGLQLKKIRITRIGRRTKIAAKLLDSRNLRFLRDYKGVLVNAAQLAPRALLVLDQVVMRLSAMIVALQNTDAAMNPVRNLLSSLSRSVLRVGTISRRIEALPPALTKTSVFNWAPTLPNTDMPNVWCWSPIRR